MFQIKICGLTTVANAVEVAAAGADAVGLNFFAGSKRHVAPALARQIAAALPDGVQRVGVFVNAELDEMRRAFEQTPLDWIQLHGDEPSEWINRLPADRVIRAVRWSTQSVGQLCRLGNESGAAALLVDAAAAGAYGGTGQTVNWQLAAELAAQSTLPLILAGGLNSSNVAAAITEVRPAGVDTASGVEHRPGVKDVGQVQQFVAAAREAFAQVAD